VGQDADRIVLSAQFPYEVGATLFQHFSVAVGV
jgi:hypothetical protein